MNFLLIQALASVARYYDDAPTLGSSPVLSRRRN
jgi:hypothetical protein